MTAPVRESGLWGLIGSGGEHGCPPRFDLRPSVSRRRGFEDDLVPARTGGFDEQGSDLTRREDGGPGNPIIGWKESGQVGVAFTFDVCFGLTFDVSFVQLDYDFGNNKVGDVDVSEAGGLRHLPEPGGIALEALGRRR